MARVQGVRKRANGTYEKRFSINGVRYSVYGATQKECLERETEKRQEILNGCYVSNNNLTLNKYYEEWKRVYKTTVKPITYNRVTGLYDGHFKKDIGKRKLKDLESREIKAKYLELLKDHKVTTTKGIMGILKMILNSAVNDNIIVKSPMPKLRTAEDGTQKANATIHRALTKSETEIFLNECKSEWLYEMILMLLNTGMRSGEGCALRWCDIDTKNNVIHIARTLSRDEDGRECISETPKTKSSKRDIPLTGTIKEILKMQKQKANLVRCGSIIDLSSNVFVTIQGECLSLCTLRYAITNTLKRLEKNGTPIEHFSAHALRDTFATRAIENGMNPQTLKAILGHSSLAMTMDLYAQVLPDTKQSEMEKIESAFKNII